MIRYRKGLNRTFQNVFPHKEVWISCCMAALPIFVLLCLQSWILQDFSAFLAAQLDAIATAISNTPDVVTNEWLTQQLETMVTQAVTIYKMDFVWTAVVGFVGIFVEMGSLYWVAFAVNKVERKQPVSIKESFGFLGKGFCLVLLESVKIFLWSLLFVVPGIVKTFEYAMSMPIFVEDPNKKITDCIKESQKKMKGRKERLFLQSLLVILVGSLIFSFASSFATSILGGVPYLGTILANAISAFASVLLAAFEQANYAVFYVEIQKDEEFLAKNPHLEEKGVNGVLWEEATASVYFDRNGNRYQVVNGLFYPVPPTELHEESAPKMPSTPFEEDEKKTEQPTKKQVDVWTTDSSLTTKEEKSDEQTETENQGENE